MVASRFIALGMAVAVSAAPFMTERDLNATTWTPGHVLEPDEVILYGEGRMEVVHASVWEKLVESQGFSMETPEVDHAYLAAGDKFSDNAIAERDEGHTLEARQCSLTTSYITDRTERFIDWDAQMSPVVIGAGRSGIDVSVAKSFSVANSVSVSAGVDIVALKKLKDRLKGSLGVDFTRTWTTQATITVRGTIHDGETGVVITRPWKTRRYGRTFRGCVGSMTQTGTFMADSFDEGSYEGVTWVAGAITLCLKRQRSIPLSRCHGSGNFR